MHFCTDFDLFLKLSNFNLFDILGNWKFQLSVVFMGKESYIYIRLSKKFCGISASLSLQARSSSCIRRIGSC